MNTAERDRKLASPSDWPSEATIILSALEAAGAMEEHAEHRSLARRRYRVRADLRLFIDPADDDPRPLYTRDVHQRGLGFISQQRLPLGYGGTLTIPLPTGRPATIACTVLRCREAIQGWYEGAVYFNRPQFDFDPDT